MNICFHSIKIHNFMSFSDAEVSLSDRGYVLVRGENNNPTDNAKSNGAGKTTIFHALSWCLTGQTLSGIRSNITNIYLDDGCFVELYFSSDGHEYRLLRAKDSKEYKTDLKLFIDDQDKSGKGIRESEKLLEQYLPELNYQLLGSVILLGQGLPQRFTNNTPSGRKEVLEKLSKSDFMIEDLKSKLSVRKTTLQNDLRQVEDTILTKTTMLNTKEQFKQQLEVSNSALNSSELASELEKIQKTQQELLEKIAYYDQVAAEYSTKDQEFIKQKDNIHSDYLSDLSELQHSYDPLIDSTQKELQAAQISYGTQNAELSRLRSIKDVCPTCGQHIPGVNRPDTSALEATVNTLSQKVLELSNKISDIKSTFDKEKLKITSSYDVKSQELTELRSKALCKLNDAKGTRDMLQSQYSTGATRLTSIQGQLASLNETKLRNEETIRSIAKEIDSLNSEILYNNTKKEEITTRISYVTKMLTLATRDFRGVLLSNIITYIDKCAKTYCQHIFETDKLNFYLDGNNIDISYDGKLYESLSTGEKQKVDIIVQLSLRDMLCKYMNFNCNILALDEVFDGLDSLGCERIVSLINNITDIESIFIITHHATDIELSYDDEIVVVKNKHGISEIR